MYTAFISCVLLWLIYFNACCCLFGLLCGSMHGSLPEEGDSVLEEPNSFSITHIHTIACHQHTDPGTDIWHGLYGSVWISAIIPLKWAPDHASYNSILSPSVSRLSVPRSEFSSLLLSLSSSLSFLLHIWGLMCVHYSYTQSEWSSERRAELKTECDS